MMKKNGWVTLAAAIWICGCLSGCGMLQGTKTPEEWFNQTLGGLAGKDAFTFTGEASVRTQDQGIVQHNLAYAGKLTNHDQLTMESMIPVQKAGKGQVKSLQSSGKPAAVSNFRRQDGGWVHLSSEDDGGSIHPSLSRFNPLEQLDGIHKLPKHIKEESSAARGTKVLRIELEPDAARSWLAEQLETEMQGIKKQSVTMEVMPKERERLEAIWNKGDLQLRQLLAKSQVKTVYHLTIDRKSGFPIRLSSDSSIVYKNLDGTQERETMVNDVAFQP